MPLATPVEAIRQARRLLGLPASEAGSAWHVRRLDGQEAYFLVHADGRVACLDADSGAMLASADSVREPVALSRERALSVAAMGDDASAELVWKPCPATMSMFDPLWLVARDGRSTYVDQRGKRWPALDPGRPGS
ncbi:MAG: hypothetical protein ABWY94_05650 [Pseudoxanthomonas sp.]